MKQTSIEERFQGFSPEAFNFLRALKRHNDREWFTPRKAQFERLLVHPLSCLLTQLGTELGPAASGIDFSPKKAIFRIYRDIRFSANKAPYKTHMAAFCKALGPPSKEETPGLYLHLEPEMVFVAAGLYTPSTRQLKSIRRTIDADPGPLKSILKDRRFKRNFGDLQGSLYKRIPDAYSPTHPNADLLLRKQWFVSKTYGESDAVSPGFLKELATDFQIALPLVGWLVAAAPPD